MKKNQRDDADEHPEDAPPRVAEPESFGTWLRRQREVREIDLREIADSSKVSMSYLRAFEEDRFDVLPAPVFAKGFLRQYARYVGLDPEEAVNFYIAANHPEGEEEPLLQPQLEPEPPSRNYFLIVLGVILALVAVVWLVTYLSEKRRNPEASTTGETSTAASPSRDTTGETAPVAGPVAQGVAPAADTAELETAPSETPEEAAEPHVPLLVTLDFVSDCWVEASVDGSERLSELKVQGESLLLEALEVVEFKVGDVAAVQVEVNGTPYEIEERAGTSVRQVRIDLEVAAALAAPPAVATEDIPESS